MNVIKLTNTNTLCDHCKHSSTNLTAFKIHIAAVTIVLCDECKHELTYELISN